VFQIDSEERGSKKINGTFGIPENVYWQQWKRL
jgi:hypothetical protein